MLPVAAEAAPAGPPWVAITLAGLAVVASLLTAVMPAVVERIKQRGAKAPPEPVAESRTDKALDLIEETMRDLRTERDEAEQEVKRLRKLLAKREAELRRHGWED